MLNVLVLIACASFSSEYFLSCLGDDTGLSANNIDEVNIKFDELFARIKLLEDKNVQLEIINAMKETEIAELNEKIEVLEGGEVDGGKAAQQSSCEETRESRSTSEARGLRRFIIVSNKLVSMNLTMTEKEVNIH